MQEALSLSVFTTGYCSKKVRIYNEAMTEKLSHTLSGDFSVKLRPSG